MQTPTSITWRRLITGGMVIVASILVAFTITAWWERRGTDQVHMSTLEALLTDFEGNQAVLAPWLDAYRRVETNSGLLLDLLDGVAENTSVTVADTLLVATVFAPIYQPTRSSVDAMLATGGLTLVRDRELGSLLPFWLQKLDDMDEEATVLREITGQLVPILARQTSLRPSYDQIVHWAFLNGSRGPSSSNSEFYADPELLGLLARRHFWAKEVVGDFEELLEIQQQIIDRIYAELG